MSEKLLLVPWFIGIVYSSIPLFWFFIHPIARRWQKMRRSPYRLLLPLWAVVGVRTYKRIADFGLHNFSGETELRPQEHRQALVTTGLHQRMRHPIYFAHLCMFIAWTIGSGLLVSFILLGVSMFITFPLMIWLEERELKSRFGQSYVDYKARVPLLPYQRRFTA